jgi:hypothetical protein
VPAISGKRVAAGKMSTKVDILAAAILIGLFEVSPP